MKVIRQLLKEFWFPLVVGVAWSAYNVFEQTGGQWSARAFINTFGPTFFLLSWLVAQWYRVGKQQRVEEGLVGIESDLKRMLSELEERTKDLVGHITGGDSVCYLIGSPAASNVLGNMLIVHHGKHPLYDVNARIVDLEAFDQIKDNLTLENIQKTEMHRHFGNLIPGHASMLREAIPLGDGPVRRFNVFYTARNGSFAQLLRFKKVDGVWRYATKVERDGTKFEQIQEGFPRDQAGNVEWDAA